MKDFLLNNNSFYEISPFSIGHIIILIIVGLAIFFIFKNKEKFKDDTIYRYILGTILLVNLIIRRGSFIHYGCYDITNHLDIGFCNFTSLLMLLYCIYGNKKIYNIVYYMVFSGPMFAVLSPNLNYDIGTYSFYSYIIVHDLVFIFNFIFMICNKKKYDRKDFINAYIFVFIYIMSINLLDIAFNLKYNFVSGLLHPANPLHKIFTGKDTLGMISLFIFGNICLFTNRFILKKVSKVNK